MILEEIMKLLGDLVAILHQLYSPTLTSNGIRSLNSNIAYPMAKVTKNAVHCKCTYGMKQKLTKNASVQKVSEIASP
jgi:hypothetical protein